MMGQTSLSLDAFHDLTPEAEEFEAALLEGLSQANKSIPCKYFYDQRGSRLFDDICTLDEYYVTRTETALLRRIAPEIVDLMGPGCHLIEFGSGSSLKIRILLDALDKSSRYTAIDISRDHLLASTDALAREYPDLAVTAVCADYTEEFDLPTLDIDTNAKPVAFFPGSSIGNFCADEAIAFLERTATQLGPRHGALLIGVDLKKDISLLEAAYNDTRGITAAFNLNLLVRANDELSAGFDLSSFHHDAIYNAEAGRIEMYIVSDRRQSVRISGERIDFADGERIHTENSHKYAIDEFQNMARAAGFDPTHVWTDKDSLFSIHYMEAT